MRKLFASVLFALMILGLPNGLVVGADKAVNIIQNGGFEEKADGEWSVKDWEQELFSSPRIVDFSLDNAVFRSGKTSLKMSGKGHPWCRGKVKQVCKNLIPGKTYRFEAYCRFQDVKYPGFSILIRFDWNYESAFEAISCPFSKEKWVKMERLLTVPPIKTKERTLNIAVTFQCSEGTVWWDDISLVESSTIPQRKVRVGVIYWRPYGDSVSDSIMQNWCRLIDKAAEDKPDILCMPEASLRGHSTIPGASIDKLAAKAAEHKVYIVVGMYEYEEESGLYYNSAVLIDRKGKIVGKYRKTHLPPCGGEEDNFTPGTSYPVFETDFGKIGILICYDIEFPEVARILALRGAEIIFFPNWGSGDIQTRARAIENGVYIVSSSYDYKSGIINPLGDIIAKTEKAENGDVVVKEITLGERIYQPYMGDFSTFMRVKRRIDIFGPLISADSDETTQK